MKNPIIAWIKWRVKKNKNAIIIFNGATGSGKTYAALRTAYDISQELGTNFTVSSNVDFKFGAFVKKTMLPENNSPGSVFLFEEVGAVGGGASSREWQTKANQFFNSFLQTTRHRNQILIMTCPQFSFLDAASRKLVHIQIDMSHINFKERKSYTKPHILQVNSRTGKIYFKYLRYTNKGKKGRLKKLGIDYPPEDIVQDYEKLKLKYTSELNKKLIDQDNKENLSRRKKHVKVDPIMVQALLNQGFSNIDIANRLNISEKSVRLVKTGKNSPLLVV